MRVCVCYIIYIWFYYIYMHIYICVYMCIYMHISVYIHVYLYVYLYIYDYLCVCVRVFHCLLIYRKIQMIIFPLGYLWITITRVKMGHLTFRVTFPLFQYFMGICLNDFVSFRVTIWTLKKIAKVQFPNLFRFGFYLSIFFWGSLSIHN